MKCLDSPGANQISFCIEISPICNLRCPECIVAKRLHLPIEERRDDKDLVKKIIERTPPSSHLAFVGLGEPTSPEGQERILSILSRRKDLIGFIQTNGTFPLREELIELIKKDRLEIGLSLDTHHYEGGQHKLGIQPEYVSSLSVIVMGNKKITDPSKHFPNLNRILLSPLMKERKILTSWKQIVQAYKSHKEIVSDKITVYAEISAPAEGENEKFLKESKRDLIPSKEKGWHLHKKYNFYIDMIGTSNPETDLRVLIDGTYIPFDLFYIGIESWQEVDKHSKPIKNLPKVFDIKTKKFLTQPTSQQLPQPQAPLPQQP